MECFTPTMINTMIVISIKTLKRKSNGVSLKDISKYMKENYHVNVQENYIRQFLENNVGTGALESINQTAGERTSNLKKTAKSQKTTQNLNNEGMRAMVKKRKDSSAENENLKKKVARFPTIDAVIKSKDQAAVYKYNAAVDLETIGPSTKEKNPVSTTDQLSEKIKSNMRTRSAKSEIGKKNVDQSEPDKRKSSAKNETEIENVAKVESDGRKRSVKNDTENETADKIKPGKRIRSAKNETEDENITKTESNKRTRSLNNEIGDENDAKTELGKRTGISNNEIGNENIANIESNKRARSAKNEIRAENVTKGEPNKPTRSAKITNEKSKISDAKGKQVLLSVTKNSIAHPPTSEMVMDSIKSLKKRNGATFDEISKQIEQKYQVNMKVLKSHVNKFLKKGTEDGILEKSSGSNMQERYKIKKLENVKDLRSKKEKPKLVPKKSAAKKSARK